METICIKTENGKTNKPHISRLTLAHNFNLKYPNKNVGLANWSIYHAWKNIESAYNKNKLKVSTPTWNDEFDLTDRSYSISDYFEYNIKNMKL